MAIPDALWTYIRGLKSHDVDLIGSTFADGIAFVTPVKTMNREEILAFLSALYRGFPDWAYDHDPPEHRGDDAYAVLWHQGGTQTQTLALPGFPEWSATDRRRMARIVRAKGSPSEVRVDRLLQEHTTFREALGRAFYPGK